MEISAREMLEQAGLSPKKVFSQNFLVDKNILVKIMDTAKIKKTDNVLEVGPGLGTLTRELVARAGMVVAVEKDHEMCEVLNGTGQRITNIQHPITKAQEITLKIEKEETGQAITNEQEGLTKNKKFELICADILKVTDEQLRKSFGGKPYRIVANLPYSITSHFLKIFLEREYAPTEMLIMIQREVGQRILEVPGQLSMLSISVQFYSDPKIEFVVHPGSFFPSPKVDSVVISLRNIRKDKYAIDAVKFFKVLKVGFSQKRKQLKAVLANSKILNKKFTADKIGEILVALHHPATARAQELSIEDWVELVGEVDLV